MSDDLVKRLRDLGDHASFEPHMHHVAADRIEELEASLEEAECFLINLLYEQSCNGEELIEMIRKLQKMLGYNNE